MWHTMKEDKKTKDIFKLQKKHCGLLNRDKIIYHICAPAESLGFFAMYRHWLEYIYFADICGYVPVIETSSDFAYLDDSKKRHNAFENYFKQPMISLNDAKRSCNVISSSSIHREMVELVLTGRYNHYKYTQKYLCYMSQVVRKYIKFNDETEKYVFEGTEKLGIKAYKMLGVHIRGTDFRKQYANHPAYISENEVFERVDNLIGKYDKLFLATDDKRILENFKGKYGTGVMCYYEDVARNDENKSVVFMRNQDERPNNKYMLGLEVIRDMYTLALCEGLIAGISQVAICSQIYKLSLKKKYEDLVIIDKGINQNGRNFRR